MKAAQLLVGVLALRLWWGSSPAASAAADADLVFGIPRNRHVVIDGHMDDWQREGGLHVDVLMPVSGALRPYSDYDIQMQLAWNDEGLLVLVVAQDDAGVEAEDEGALWSSDSVELFLAPRRGAQDWCQWVISPGLDPKHPELRWHTHHSRKDQALKDLPGDLKTARTKVPGGYVLEALLPWQSLGVEPRVNQEVGFQILANDRDPEESNFRLMWYPGQRTSRDSSLMHRLRLAEQAGPHVFVLTRRQYDTEQKVPVIQVTGPPECAGQEIVLRAWGKTVAQARLETDESGRSARHFVVPFSKLAGEEERVKFAVELEGQTVETFTLPASVAHIPHLLGQQQTRRRQFGIDRPWDEMRDAPALIQRHRGMVAEALRWVEEGSSPSGEDQLEALARAAEMAVALEAGQDYLAAQRNEFWSAYYSQADGSGQVFVTVVPPDFAPSKTYPLVVQLHGAADAGPDPDRTADRRGAHGYSPALVGQGRDAGRARLQAGGGRAGPALPDRLVPGAVLGVERTRAEPARRGGGSRVAG